MTKKTFDKIEAGLKDALEIARGGNEMPLYTCHKKVRALEIAFVTDDGPAGHNVFFRDEAFPPVLAPAQMFTRYFPAPGDFYVVYEGDGYVSFSPRKAFLDGYTRDGPSFAEIKQELKP